MEYDSGIIEYNNNDNNNDKHSFASASIATEVKSTPAQRYKLTCELSTLLPHLLLSQHVYFSPECETQQTCSGRSHTKPNSDHVTKEFKSPVCHYYSTSCHLWSRILRPFETFLNLQKFKMTPSLTGSSIIITVLII